MNHTYTNDGRILTSPRELKPLLKETFIAFEKAIGYIRFFYIADELWNGEYSLVFNAKGKKLASFTLGDGFFDIFIAGENFKITGEKPLKSVFEMLNKSVHPNNRRPAPQLKLNLNQYPCGFRCDMCLPHKAYNENDLSFSEKFDYMNWLCYRNCIDVDMDLERNKYTKATCPGCAKSSGSNCQSKYFDCATKKGYADCAECGGYHICDAYKNSHYPGQCNLGLTAEEVTSLVIPYAMKERLDFSRNSVL